MTGGKSNHYASASFSIAERSFCKCHGSEIRQEVKNVVWLNIFSSNYFTAETFVNLCEQYYLLTVKSSKEKRLRTRVAVDFKVDRLNDFCNSVFT